MKLNRNVRLLIAAAATVGAGTTLAPAASAAVEMATTAADTLATTPAPGTKHWRHRHGSLLVATTLHAARQLGLSSDQQQRIKGILSAARSERLPAAGTIDIAALGNPADPNYATALQNVKTLATARLQRESELQTQIYDVLTADQRAKLPQVLADMKAKAQQRRAARQQASSGAPADAAGSN